MKTICASSWKGGTGKTTITTLIAETLAKRGNKVLIIGLDPNCSISETYKHILCDRTSKQLYFGVCVEPYHIKTVKNQDGKDGDIDLIPEDLELNLMSNVMDLTLKNQIKKAGYSENYDYCIIDPPGNWCAHTRNAIYASDKLIIAGSCSALDFRATQAYFEQLQNCDLNIDVSVVITRYNAKVNQDEILEKYNSAFGEFLFSEPIPEIKSLRKLTSNPDYSLLPQIQNRLNNFVTQMTEF